MQSIAATIFTNKRMNQWIEKAHTMVKEQTLSQGTFTFKPEELTMYDFLADPDIGLTHRSHAQMVDYVKGKAIARAFGLNLLQNVMLKARRDFVESLREESTALDYVDTRPEVLANLSLRAKSASIALAFKYYWICKDIEYPFRGMLASTTPVRRALKELFGLSGEQATLNDFQHRLAHEVGVEPNRLNTALFVLGARLQGVEKAAT